MSFRKALCLAATILAGCAANHHETGSVHAPEVCPASFDGSRFEIVTDSSLTKGSVGLPEAGGVRCATVLALKAGQTATVHRVYGSGARPYRRWWTFSLPGTDSSAYRKQYGICPAWNSLDSLVTCELAPGTRIALGPGQSVRCGTDPTYPASDSLQVFLANPSRDLDSTRCTFRRMEWK